MTPARILIVEDDAILAAHLENVLTQLGYHVAGFVATGPDAIAVAQAQTPDVILMDIHLRGEMTGIEAATQINRQAAIPIVYLTAYTDETLLQQAKITEAYAYLAKPVRERELRASLEMALYKHRTEQRLQHLNQVLRAVRDVNQLITREHNPQQLLDDACKILVRARGYRLVWIGRREDRHVKMVALAGADQTLQDAIAAAGLESLQNLPHLVACYQNQIIACQNLFADEAYASWRDLAERFRFFSLAAMPVRHGEQQFGGLCVLSDRTDMFDAEELDLLLELAGDIAFGLKTLDDEAQRRQMETALAESEERYRLLLEHAPVGIAVHAAGRIVFANPAGSKILGANSPAQIIGRPISDIVHPDNWAAAQDRVRRLLAGELDLYPVEDVYLRLDGTPVPVQVMSVPFTYQGQPAVQVIVLDITARKQAEAVQDKLEGQLRQAQKMESIGRLAGGVAHDFNNLLTVIQGYSDLMQFKIPADDPLRKELEQIQVASRRASALTRQLLAFSRKQILDLTLLNLNELVSNLHKMLERLIGEDIRLTTVLQPEVWSIMADAGQIEQVIMNLVVNARDAMPTGGQLTIETRNINLDDDYASVLLDAPRGPCVLLSVTDTGHGMDNVTQAHIFEPFFTTKDSGKGTGLGLATVYGIVKQSGGHIAVYSEVGRGTTFKIYLPAQNLPAAPPVVHVHYQVPGGSETILLVEDEDLVRTLVQTALQNEGYTILKASHGAEALSLCAEHPGGIDLLLTDVIMPQMSGRELAEQLKTLYPALKILFISGYTDDAVVRHGLLAAEVEFLSKPFEMNKLAAKVREILDR